MLPTQRPCWSIIWLQR